MQEERAEREAEARALAVTRLQAGLRGWLTRREYGAMLKARRGKELKRKEWAVCRLQALARGLLVRQTSSPALKRLRTRRVKLGSGVTPFQAHVRGYLVRRACCVRLQQQERVRSKQARRKAENLDRIMTELQATSRGYLTRRASKPELDQLVRKRHVRRFEASVVWVQACCRGYLTRHSATEKCRQSHGRNCVAERPLIACNTGSVPANFTSADNTVNASSNPMPAAVSAVTPNPTSIYTSPTSPSKPKLTLVRRLQSALKVLQPISPPLPPPTPRLTSTTPPTFYPASSSYPSSPLSGFRGEGLTKNVNKVSSAPHLLREKCDSGGEVQKPAGRRDSGGEVQKPAGKHDLVGDRFMEARRGWLECEGMVNSGVEHDVGRPGVGGKANVSTDVESGSGDMQALVAEERALQEVVKSRVEELAVAQQARERMSTIFGEDEIRIIAERQRARASYRKELEHSASPLLPKAWLGIIEDRLETWKENRSSWKKKSQQGGDRSSQDYRVAKSMLVDCRPLTRAQLLAASIKGTSLEEVVEVVVYRSRHAVDLSSLQQCPKLRTTTLVKCGLETVTGLLQEHCPRLIELNLPVSLHTVEPPNKGHIRSREGAPVDFGAPV